MNDENSKKILEKANELIGKEIDAASTIVELNKIAIASKMLDEKAATQDETVKKLRDELKIEKIDLKEQKLELDMQKFEQQLKERELTLKEKENQIKILAIAGSVLVAVVTSIGGIIKQVIAIKHADKIYGYEMYQNYHDRMIETPTQKDIARYSLNDAMKEK